MSKFINPALVVAQTGLSSGMTVCDLGCGSGFYVLPAAQLVGQSGTVYAVDLSEQKLEATASIAKQMNYQNVRVVKADLTQPLTVVPESSCDLVILSNILHEIPNREVLIKNAYRVMGASSGLLAVEWKKELTPFGPPMSQRVDETQLTVMLMQAGLQKVKEIEADGYHYAVLYRK